MRINIDKFPALFDDEIVIRRYNGILSEESMKKMKDVIDAANTVRTYITRTIITPMLESYKKLIPHRKELKDSCRALLYHSKAGNPHVIHYVFLVEEDRINIMGQTHFIIPDGRDFGLLFNVWIDREETDTVTFRSYVDVPPILPIEKHDDMVSTILSALVSAELFINFAEVETKTMKPNTQIWDERMVNALYNNRTNKDITVIDSKWYTELISSGAFNVRGHWRMQPCGPGMKNKKLIWINEFQKEGYHRKAKIEEEQNREGNE